MKSVPNEFWIQPPAALTDPNVMAIYNWAADAMREELAKRGANVVDLMLGERAVFLYGHQRQRETIETADGKSAWDNDRIRKETLHEWAALVENLQRRWLKEDLADAQEHLKASLINAVNDALLDVDPTVAETLRDALATELEKAGL